MKVEIDLENLEYIIENTINEDIENLVKDQVNSAVRKQIDKIAADKIEDVVSDNFERFVNEYISTTIIKISGDFWGDRESKEYTVEQFIKEQLREKLESNTLKVKKKGRTSSYNDDYENVSFEEYIKRTCNINEEIHKVFNDKLNRFMNDIRIEINKTMKDTFDNSTKSMLSSAVLNILSANDTYRQIENNIKCIADKKD